MCLSLFLLTSNTVLPIFACQRLLAVLLWGDEAFLTFGVWSLMLGESQPAFVKITKIFTPAQFSLLFAVTEANILRVQS